MVPWSIRVPNRQRRRWPCDGPGGVGADNVEVSLSAVDCIAIPELRSAVLVVAAPRRVIAVYGYLDQHPSSPLYNQSALTHSSDTIVRLARSTSVGCVQP